MEIRDLIGDGTFGDVVEENNRSGKRRMLGARAIFAFVGAEANAGWLEGTRQLEEKGFVLSGEAPPTAKTLDAAAWRDRQPLLFETSLPGAFAVGGVKSGPIKPGSLGRGRKFDSDPVGPRATLRSGQG